jgi:hypothetical protein
MKASGPSSTERERRLREAKIVANEPIHPLLTCLTPRDYAATVGTSTEPCLIKIKNEEDAAVWLWVKPGLLMWPRRLEWLWSPVVGSKGWNVGDLWGIDEAGELLLLENKRLSGTKAADPFKKFDKCEEAAEKYCDADALWQRWKVKYKLEITSRPKAIEVGDGTQGILPNSNRRECLKRWPDLAAKIDERIRHRGYVDTVKSFLERRRTAKNRPPHYCGLFVARTTGVEVVLARSHGSMGRLQEAAPNRVHLFVARAEAVSAQQTRVIVSRLSS